MSCAVVAMPFSTMNNHACGKFRGDADHLVDRLIAACERPVAHDLPTGPGYGRELVPWCPDEVDSLPSMAPLEAKNRRGSKSGNEPTKKHPRSNGVRAPSSPEHKKPNKGGLNNSSVHASTSAPRAAPAASGFACPAVASSPKPEAVPMPTSALMSRALARGRSPSPGKQATPVYSTPAGVQALQRLTAVA